MNSANQKKNELSRILLALYKGRMEMLVPFLTRESLLFCTILSLELDFNKDYHITELSIKKFFTEWLIAQCEILEKTDIPNEMSSAVIEVLSASIMGARCSYLHEAKLYASGKNEAVSGLIKKTAKWNAGLNKIKLELLKRRKRFNSEIEKYKEEMRGAK